MKLRMWLSWFELGHRRGGMGLGFRLHGAKPELKKGVRPKRSTADRDRKTLNKHNAKGPCAQIVYTLALKYSLYRYIGPKVYTIWVHGPLG